MTLKIVALLHLLGLLLVLINLRHWYWIVKIKQCEIPLPYDFRISLQRHEAQKRSPLTLSFLYLGHGHHLLYFSILPMVTGVIGLIISATDNYTVSDKPPHALLLSVAYGLIYVFLMSTESGYKDAFLNYHIHKQTQAELEKIYQQYPVTLPPPDFF